MSSFTHPDSPASDGEKDHGGNVNSRDIKSDANPTSGDESDSIDENAQGGVQKVEAIAKIWPKSSLWAAYVLIWLIYLAVLLQQYVSAVLVAYVTSSFAAHPLTATVSVLASVIGGCANLTLAKILDIWGRPQGFGISVIIATVGYIMMAKSTSVEMYAAAMVFTTVGNNTLLYAINIFVADTSALKSRALMVALTSSPNLIALWLGGPVASHALYGPGWPWGYGAFAIVVPVVCAPLYALMMFYDAKARRAGLLPARSSGRSVAQSVLHYVREFDALGLLLLTAGLALFLLSFNLYTYQAKGWGAPMIICFLVFGIVLIVLFAVWELFAPVTFIPFTMLVDRNMLGSCFLGMTLFISYYCWYVFFASYLQVVNDLSPTRASYVENAYSVGGNLFAIVCGVYVRKTGRFKDITLYFSIPLYVLFMGLLIYFRRQGDVGYLVMCQVFLSISCGVLTVTPQIAPMVTAPHQDIAVILAIVAMFSSIGGAIGLTIATAIWNAIFPYKLLAYLPPDAQANYESIYLSIDTQLSYPVGSPERIAIQHAYTDSQKMMLVAGTAIWVLGFASAAIWRESDVRKIKQVKGQVIA